MKNVVILAVCLENTIKRVDGHVLDAVLIKNIGVKKMLINIDNLDKTKTYVCNEVGSSAIAKIIQSLSHKIYSNIPPEQIASHTFALVYINDCWQVYENHLRWAGIKMYSVSEYNEINKNSDTKDILVNEYHLDCMAMAYWHKYNPGYSVTNLFEVTEERLIGLKLPNTKGWICSETIAAMNYQICMNINKPFTEITPVDWQVCFMNKGK